jgi:NAD-dependent aldehyde dehydrogenases
MENTSTARISEILRKQRDFFASGVSRSLDFRKKQLSKLLSAIERNESRIEEALWTDLHKSHEEAYLTEIALVKAEIRTHLRHVAAWARRERRHTPLTMFPSRSYVVKEPLGNTLIVSPWNYPFQLLLNPLVGAVSSGCTAILKPSPYVPNVSLAIQQMIEETFDCEYVAVVQGNRDVNSFLFDQRFDMIFFTGSPALAKKVMEAAARNLTPLVLELGGKSPCIIDRKADIKLSARRIAWGKTLNSGQTCIAPDYIIIHEDVKEQFVKEFGAAMEELHGKDIHEDRHYVRMVNDKAFERVCSYLECGRIVYGGRTISNERFIEPTLLDDVRADSPVMTEEIFGPVFPMITFGGDDFLQKAARFVTEREKPLAFYYFGDERDGWDIIGRTSSGGGCINDTIMHIVNDKVPFGGVGNSGMGHYHNKLSFDAFTHERSVIVNPKWIDLPFRYMPYKFFKLDKWLM